LVRRSQKQSREFVVDTTFLLPYLGIRVRGLDEDVLSSLLPCYPIIMLVELLGVLYKEAKKKGLQELPEQALEGFNSIVYGKDIKLIFPTEEDLCLGYEVMRRGWKDIFDVMLYATAKRLGIKALTMDSSFKSFLREAKLDHEVLEIFKSKA